jgi:predicted alpha/beta hydrolase family esterase
VKLLMVPGIEGSDERHWQTLWQDDLGNAADRIAPASWDDPDHDDWLAAISRSATADTVVVAHSLGCLAVTSWLIREARSLVAGAFLVSPPDPTGPAFPAAAASFPRLRGRLPVPAVVVASSDDPFVRLEVAREMAAEWGADFVDAGANGHLNSDSSLGRWKAGREQLDAFVGSLGPQPAAGSRV